MAVAFLRWKSAVLFKCGNEGPGSPETPLPTAGSGPHGVKFRPRWAVLWKSFVRNQHLARKGTVLRSRMVKTTTSHSPFKGQALPPLRVWTGAASPSFPHPCSPQRGPGGCKNYPLPEKASLKPFPPLFPPFFFFFS